MNKNLLLFMLFVSGTSIFAQVKFDESKLQEVQTLIMNKEHDKADSILDYYQKYPQDADASFCINLAKCFNGYERIKTDQDVSVIVPYSNAGKDAFAYIKNNINSGNATLSNCWPILRMFSEIFNGLNGCILDDIANFSTTYYDEYEQRDIFSYYIVMLNTFQHHFARSEWQFAVDAMSHYYRFAIEAKDTTIRLPISAAFVGFAYLRNSDANNASKWFSNSYKRFQKFDERNNVRAYCELLIDMAQMYNLQGNNEIAYKYAKEACEANKANYGEASSEYVNALGVLSDCEFGLNKTDIGLQHIEKAVEMLDSIPQMSIIDKQSFIDKLNFVYLILNVKNKKTNVNDSIVTVNSITYEATNDLSQGRIENGVSKLKRLWDYYDTHFQLTALDNYVFVVVSLSNALVSLGNYAEADNILNESIEFLREKGINSQLYRGLYESKGLLYYTINNVDMALYWYNQAKDMYVAEDEKSLQYGMLISNLV